MPRSILAILVILLILAPIRITRAQSESSTIQANSVIERTLARGQSHSFSINLEPEQFLQVVVDQHGIDVIVRAFSPEGKMLSEVDSPNGTEGPENISLTSTEAGVYRIEVAPLGQNLEAAPGRYELKVVELRHATDQEILATKNQEILKARGLALINEVTDNLAQIRLPQTRVRAQLQAAQMVWSSDEKLGAKLAADAVEGVKEFISGLETSDQDYYQTYAMAMQMRQEVLQTLGSHDPDLALKFLRSTRSLLTNPNGQTEQFDQELSMEVSLGTRLATNDPARAVQLARDTLKQGDSSMLVELIARLRARNPELATQLAKEVAAKLMGEKLLKTQDTANLALGLLQLSHSPVRNFQPAADAPPPLKGSTLLSEQEYRDLFEKALNEALAYVAPSANRWSPETSSAQTILSSLKSLSAEMKAYAPDKAAVIDKKVSELNTPNDPQNALWQKYQETINNSPLEAGLEEVSRAPREIREQLYQQLAQKAASTGDFARARQIIKDNIRNPAQQRQILANIDQQAVFMEASKGRFEEALRGVSNLRTVKERAQVISQIVNQIGPGLKRAQALDLLEQARNLVGPSLKVESQEQMSALLEIARAFSRYDSKKAFEIIEPLLDQFDDMANAAQVLNGFGQDFYEGGELQLNNGNSVATIANQLIQSLASLTPANFDRAKAGADRLERPEVRIIAYLSIAQQAINPDKGSRRPVYNRF